MVRHRYRYIIGTRQSAIFVGSFLVFCVWLQLFSIMGLARKVFRRIFIYIYGQKCLANSITYIHMSYINKLTAELCNNNCLKLV